MCDRKALRSGRATGRHNWSLSNERIFKVEGDTDTHTGVNVVLRSAIRSLQLDIGHGGMVIADSLTTVVVVRVAWSVRRG
jgi:hypothetical protein